MRFTPPITTAKSPWASIPKTATIRKSGNRRPNLATPFARTPPKCLTSTKFCGPTCPRPKTFHCPADIGWEQTKLPAMRGGIRDVKPSSYAKFGTSYYCFTVWGFAQKTANDIPDPANTLLVFDGDLWHRNAGQDGMNGLFADGHVQKLTAAQFEVFARG